MLRKRVLRPMLPTLIESHAGKKSPFPVAIPVLTVGSTLTRPRKGGAAAAAVTAATMSFYSRRPFWMRQTAHAQACAPRTSVSEFQDLLAQQITGGTGGGRVIALCGAGLSASSGLPTFRGAGGLWRRHEATYLATPEAFAADPALVWLFYAWRRHVALRARPNAGHVTLARLARLLSHSSSFLCLTQNVDGLAVRAGHPPEQLRELHGSLWDLICFTDGCGYAERGNRDDPLCDALAPAAERDPAWLADPDLPVPEVRVEDLPHCPSCRKEGRHALLRPGVVWFGESLDERMLAGVDDWMEEEGEKIDIMLVVGTAAVVQPAASYVRKAKRRGAVVVVVNTDPDAVEGLGADDFFFLGDAAEILPRLFEKVLGDGGGGADDDRV